MTVTSTDSQGAETSETFTINVADVNEAATANAGSETTSENVVLNGQLTGSDLDGDDLSYSLVSGPSSGSVTVNADGSYDFDPGSDFDYLAAGESETVSFTFQVDDGRGSTDTATVDVVVTGSNDGPTAVALSGNNVTENLTGVVVGTLATKDVDSTDTHEYSVSDARFEVVNNELKLVDGVSLDFENEPTVSVIVTSTDSQGAETSETFTINVADVNEAATANAGSETTSENVVLNGQLTGSDLDGDDLTYSLVSGPSSGSVTVHADGSYDFDPGSDFDYLAVGESETVSFTFQVDDGRGSTDSATVDVVVTGSNDGPTAVALSGNSVDENFGGAIIGALSTSDVDLSDSHEYQVSDARFEVIDGQLKLVDGVSLDHETEPTIKMTVLATDNEGGETSREFTIHVNDVNEPVVAVEDSFRVAEDDVLQGNILANDYHVDRMEVVAYEQSNYGTVIVESDGSFLYAPDPHYSGPDSFSYTVEDEHGLRTTQRVQIEVTAVADGVDLNATNQVSAVGVKVPLDISANFLDADGSESISRIIVSNVPEGAKLSSGVDNGDGSWTVQPEDLEDLSLLPASQFGEISLGIEVVTTDGESEISQVSSLQISVLAQGPIAATEPAPEPPTESRLPENSGEQEPSEIVDLIESSPFFTETPQEFVEAESESDIWKSSKWDELGDVGEETNPRENSVPLEQVEAVENETENETGEELAESTAIGAYLPEPGELTSGVEMLFDPEELESLEFQLEGGIETESGEESAQVAAKSLLLFLATREDRRKGLDRIAMKKRKNKAEE